MEMERDLWEVHYANGQVDFASSHEEAQTLVMQKTGHDQAPSGLLPAQIWKTNRPNIGVGELVETIHE